VLRREENNPFLSDFLAVAPLSPSHQKHPG